jgi:A/G-specific adenine glycosylase
VNHADRIRAFVAEIWAWYARHKRTLPWRDLNIKNPTERAYRILVSEVMLQQTQVPRVIIKYKEFLERFPTLESLASASNKDVLLVWRGMGYNSRALRLRDAAREIENGKWKMENFPTSMNELTSIKGIGTYTAAAIRNFAFNLPTPCLDTNIRRILHRTFVGPENADGTWAKDDGFLLKIASEVLEEAIRQKATKGTRETKERTFVPSVPFVSSVASSWHAALMDFGSLVQTKRNPKWDVCPLTAKGIMKAMRAGFELRVAGCGNLKLHASKQEPGRHVGSTFVPNRIFRGRVIDALRDSPRGLTLHDIGKRIALDWNPAAHRKWLRDILSQLTCETLITERRSRYILGT